MGIRIKRSLARKVAEAAAIVLLAVLLLPNPRAILAIALLLHLLNRVGVSSLIWLWWLPKGKDVLFVSSESPVWKDYMEVQILPLVAGRAVVLNWSERKKWSRWSLPVRAFRVFGGWRNFNPIIVLFRPFRRARIFRFLPALKEWKHGDGESLEQLRRELVLALGPAVVRGR